MQAFRTASELGFQSCRLLLQEVERAEGVEGEGQDEFGGVLRRRGRAADASEPQAQAGADAGNTQKLLNEYFGADDAQLGEVDRFLKKFIANKARLQCCYIRENNDSRLICLDMLSLTCAQHASLNALCWWCMKMHPSYNML